MSFSIKKRYVFLIISFIVLIFFAVSVVLSNGKESKQTDNSIPRIGEKLWTYNIPQNKWSNYKQTDDIQSNDIVVLQTEGNSDSSTYRILSGNQDIQKDNLNLWENSKELIVSNNLISYFPKKFEIYNIVFNGVNFIPDKLNDSDISKVFRGYRIIKVSSLKNNNVFKFSKENNKFVILNDIGDKFYQYYIVPNDGNKLLIGDLSNQFEVKDRVDIKIQRLEGCTKAYPCYELHIK